MRREGPVGDGQDGPPRWTVFNAEPQGYAAEARALLGTVARVVDGPVDRAGLLEAVRGADALIVRLGHRVDDDVLRAGQGRLRAVASATTGLDHVDLAAAERRGVTVLSLRGETDFLRTVHATAEHTWALLLALVRRIPWAARSVLEGEWDRDRFRGSELAGRTLGLVGLGRLGRRVAAYGQAFGMDVRAYDPYIERWPDGIRRYSELDELLAASDVVSIHVPLDDTTRRLIDRERLARFRPGSVLVNTSRGAILDESAVVEALEAGRLAGVAVDVLEGEADPDARARSPLLERARRREDVLVTPHVAGATRESMARTEVFMAKKLVSFLEGER